jgi:RNA polymerase sigma factor (sigma-70 family)
MESASDVLRSKYVGVKVGTADMSSQSIPLDHYLRNYCDGNKKMAFEEIFSRYVRRLTNLASRQFDSTIRFQADPEGVVQSVYRSFFARDLTTYKLENWESLWKLLAFITLRKCYKKRTKVRKSPIMPPGVLRYSEGELSDSSEWIEAIDQQPTPAQAAALTETVSQLFSELKPREREMAEALLQGYTAVEIAARFDCSNRTVRRLRQHLRETLEEMSVDYRKGL